MKFPTLFKSFKDKMWYICKGYKSFGDCVILEGNIQKLSKRIALRGMFDGIELEAIVFNGELQGSIDIKCSAGELWEHRIDDFIQGLREFQADLKKLTTAPASL